MHRGYRKGVQKDEREYRGRYRENFRKRYSYYEGTEKVQTVIPRQYGDCTIESSVGVVEVHRMAILKGWVILKRNREAYITRHGGGL